MRAGPLDVWLNRRLGRDPQGPPPSPEALGAWQMGRLRETVALAREESPFYREHLRGADPAALRGPDDLARLPRMEAAALCEAPESLLCTSQDAVARVVTLDTSGSTGAPKRLFFSDEDLESTADFFRHGMDSMVGFGEGVLALLPEGGPGGVGRLLTQAVSSLGACCDCRPEPWDVPAVLERLLEGGARTVVGAPVHVHALARMWAARGLPRGQVKNVLLCWDVIPEGLAERTARLLGCRILNHWGMTETGLGGAVDCGAGAGMHLREADILVEITDPRSGAPLTPGNWGEITVSTLSRRAMPLVRYRTGDLGRLLPGPCPCASPLRLLDQVPGRLDARRPAMADLDAALLQAPEIVDFSARLGEGRSVLELDLYLLPGAAPDEAALCRRLESVPGMDGLTPRLARVSRDGSIAPGFAKRAVGMSNEEESQ